MSEQKINVGIIGLGYWGPKLARNFNDLPNAEFAMASDLRLERLKDITELYPNVKTTRNYQEMLDDESIQAVVIATPVNLHYPLAKDALLANKHVMVEKPITSDSDQARELISLAKERDLRLMVGHTFEYNPAVETVRQIVQSGDLGQIYYVHSTRVNLGLLQPDINVMWDLAPHDLSILRYVLGADPVKVSARGGSFINTSRKLHEVAYVIMTFPDGTLATVHVSWLDPEKQRKLTIVGSKKMLVYDDIADDKVMIFDKGVEVPPYSVTEEEFHASYHHGEGQVYPFEWSEPLRSECNHFVECILSGSTPRSDGLDGLRIVQSLETAQRSLSNGGVELNIEY